MKILYNHNYTCPARDKSEPMKESKLEQMNEDHAKVLTDDVLEKAIEEQIKQIRSTREQRKKDMFKTLVKQASFCKNILYMRDLHLRQLQHLKKELKAIQTIKDFNLHRYKVLQLQKNKNYVNEYQRILGELSQTNLPPDVKTRLRGKRKELEKTYADIAKNNLP